MKKTPKKSSAISAERIARLADAGKDVSRFFTNSGRMMPAIQRVNVDFTGTMVDELDQQAEQLNISRQAVIKTLLRQALDQRYMAVSRSRSVSRRRKTYELQRRPDGEAPWPAALTASRRAQPPDFVPGFLSMPRLCDCRHIDYIACAATMAFIIPSQ